MREMMLIRHQMLYEVVLAREASAWDAARAMMEVTVEAGGRDMSGSDVTSQIALASIMLEATLVWTVMALIDDIRIETWNWEENK
jgi:hypothetical protein